MIERTFRVTFIGIAVAFASIGHHISTYMLLGRKSEIELGFDEVHIPLILDFVGITTIIYYLGRIFGYWLCNFMTHLGINQRTIACYFLVGIALCHFGYLFGINQSWQLLFLSWVQGVFQIDYIVVTAFKQIFDEPRQFKVIYFIILCESISKLAGYQISRYLLIDNNFSFYNLMVGTSVIFLGFILYLALEKERQLEEEIQKRRAQLSLQNDLTSVESTFDYHNMLLADFYEKSAQNLINPQFGWNKVDELKQKNEKNPIFTPQNDKLKIEIPRLSLPEEVIDEEGGEYLDTSPAIKLNLHSIRIAIMNEDGQKDLENSGNEEAEEEQESLIDNEKEFNELSNSKSIIGLKNPAMFSQSQEDVLEAAQNLGMDRTSSSVQLSTESRKARSHSKPAGFSSPSKDLQLVEGPSISQIQVFYNRNNPNYETDFFSGRDLVRNLLTGEDDSQLLDKKKAPEITQIINQEVLIPLIINQFVLTFITGNTQYQENLFYLQSLKGRPCWSAVSMMLSVLVYLVPLFFRTYSRSGEIKLLKVYQTGFIGMEATRALLFYFMPDHNVTPFFVATHANFVLSKMCYIASTALFFVLLVFRQRNAAKELFVVGLATVITMLIPRMILSVVYAFCQMEERTFEQVKEIQLVFSALGMLSWYTLRQIDRKLDY